MFLLIGLQLTLLICTWSAQAAKMTSLDVFGFDPTCPDSDDEPITDVEDWVPYKYFTIIIMANPYQISNIGHGKLINIGRNLNQMNVYICEDNLQNTSQKFYAKIKFKTSYCNPVCVLPLRCLDRKHWWYSLPSIFDRARNKVICGEWNLIRSDCGRYFQKVYFSQLLTELDKKQGAESFHQHTSLTCCLVHSASFRI